MSPRTNLPLRLSAPSAVVLLALVAGCRPAGTTTPSPSLTGSSGPTATAGTGGPSAAPVVAPSPTDQLLPRPSGTLAWPTGFAVEMANGRYFTSPPFVIGLSLTISEPGWHAGHLNPVFIDLQRYDGVDVGGLPTRMLGFGWPSNVQGSGGPVPITGLTPGTALDLLVERSSVTSGERATVELFGLEGERMDLHSASGNNPVFGTADGNFGLGPELDLRLVALPLDEGLLMVAVLAPGDDLDAAWEQALPMLESVELFER